MHHFWAAFFPGFAFPGLSLPQKDEKVRGENRSLSKYRFSEEINFYPCQNNFLIEKTMYFDSYKKLIYKTRSSILTILVDKVASMISVFLCISHGCIMITEDTSYDEMSIIVPAHLSIKGRICWPDRRLQQLSDHVYVIRVRQFNRLSVLNTLKFCN